jgi:hypothetical protein
MLSTVVNPPLRGLRTQVAALCGILLLGWSGLASAVGTASSTSISNRSSLTFSVGGIPQTLIESSPAGNSTPGATNGADTSFVVDNKVDVLVTEGNTTFTSVSPGQTAAVTTFTVTNQGNTVQDFALAAANLANGTTLFGGTDNFDGTGCAAYRESGVTAGYQAAQDTATYVDELTADGTATVYVVCDIPAGQANNSNAVVSLTATARAGGAAGSLGAALTETAGANTAGVDIVFADDAGTDDGNRDAAHSARDAYRVVAAALTVSKTVAVLCDPLNSITNPKNIPGAVVRWTITVANAAGAGASATLTQVSDALNANSTFDPDLITGAGGAAGCEGASGGAGTPENANGRGFKLDVTGDTRPGAYPKFFTTANDGDGADLNGAAVRIDYGPAMPAEGTYTAGELKPGESVIVYFNVSIN